MKEGEFIMRLSKFRMFGLFALTALAAGAVVLPTQAEEPTPTQIFKPRVIAQSSATAMEFDATEDANAAAENALGAETRSQVEQFLNTASSNTAIALPIPVTDFTYANGGIGEINGSTNKTLLRSFFKSEFGVLGGASDSVVEGPVRATATSTFSPNLTSAELNNLKSVTVKFEYAFASAPKDILVLIVRNVTTGNNTFSTVLFPPGEKFVNITIQKTAFATTGKYAIIYRLVKAEKTDTDVAGFKNVTLTLVSK